MPNSRPFWRSTTIQGVATAATGLLGILASLLAPRLAPVSANDIWLAAVQVIGAIINLIGLIVAVVGRARSDGAALTLK